MFKIPNSFRDDEYLTIPPMKTFIKANEVAKGLVAKEEYLAAIEDYANQSEDNSLQVKEWLEGILKAGIKEVFMTYYEPIATSPLFSANKVKVEQLLANAQPQTRLLCEGNIPSKFALHNYTVTDTDKGMKIELTYARRLVQFNSMLSIGTVISYPVFVDIYPAINLVCIRAKSKANLFDSTNSSMSPAETNKYTLPKIVDTIKNMVYNLFGLEEASQPATDSVFKRKLYCVLDKYTFTPQLIKKMLIDGQSFIQQTATSLLEQFEVGLSGSFDDVVDDITNMAEKYISINYPDSDIFTQDREAYPLKLKAKDEEESSVEQTSAHEQPLQAKAVFFDNKKMLQKAKSCEGVKFAFNRKNKNYHLHSTYTVSLSAKSGYCNVKFHKFTDEEDIENVLFQIINADE